MTDVYLTNDNLIQVKNLKNKATDAFLNAATVTAVVNKTDGTELVSSITLSYKAASNGIYQGSIADTESLVFGAKYDVVITADGGAGLKATWTVRVTAGVRPE